MLSRQANLARKWDSLRSAVTKLSVAPRSPLSQVTEAGTPVQLELWSNPANVPARESALLDRSRVTFGDSLASAGFNEIDLSISPHDETIWCFMRPAGPPSFTPTLLRELISMRRMLQRMFGKFAARSKCAREIFRGRFARIPASTISAAISTSSSRVFARAISRRCAITRMTASTWRTT